MSVYVRNLKIDSGADFSEELQLTQTGGAVVNLSGFTAHSHLRKHPNSSKYTVMGVYINNAAQGKVTVSLASTTTLDIKEGRYVWDLLLVRPNNTKTIAVEGTALVTVGISSF
jgi:hypothetical protein